MCTKTHSLCIPMQASMFTSASVCVFSLHSINAFMQSIPLQSICCVFSFHDCNRHDKAQLQNYEASMFLLRYTFSSSAFGGAPNVLRCLGACETCTETVTQRVKPLFNCCASPLSNCEASMLLLPVYVLQQSFWC